MVLLCYFIFLLVFTSSLRSNQTAVFDLRSVVNSLLPESHLPDLLRHVPECDPEFLYAKMLVEDPTVFLQKIFEELAIQLNGERNKIRHYGFKYNKILYYDQLHDQLQSFLSTMHLSSSVLLLLSIDSEKIYKFLQEDLIPHNALQDFFSSYLTVQNFRSALLFQGVNSITNLNSLSFFLRLWMPQQAFSVDEDSLSSIISSSLSQVESVPFDNHVVLVKSLARALLGSFPFKNHWEMKIVRDLLCPQKGILTSALSTSFQVYGLERQKVFEFEEFNKIFLLALSSEITCNSNLLFNIFGNHVEHLKRQFLQECLERGISLNLTKLNGGF